MPRKSSSSSPGWATRPGSRPRVGAGQCGCGRGTAGRPVGRSRPRPPVPGSADPRVAAVRCSVKTNSGLQAAPGRPGAAPGLDAHRGHTGAFFPPCWCWGGAPEPRKQRQRRLLTEDTDRIQMARGVWQSAVTVRAKETDHPAWHCSTRGISGGRSFPCRRASAGCRPRRTGRAGAAHRRRFHRRPGGAPLPLRLFVESVLAVSQQDRRSGKPTDLNISPVNCCRGSTPGSASPPYRVLAQDYSGVHALDSDEARIPILDPDTGRHEMRRIVSVGGIPPRRWTPRSLAGNPDSPLAVVFLTSIIDEIVGVATDYADYHAISHWNTSALCSAKPGQWLSGQTSRR